jgi:hypothetical protein
MAGLDDILGGAWKRLTQNEYLQSLPRLQAITPAFEPPAFRAARKRAGAGPRRGPTRGPRPVMSDRGRDELRMAGLLAGIAAACLVLGGLVLLFTQQPARDPLTGCPMQGAPEAHTVVLVDQTDSLDADELGYLRDLVGNEYAWLPIGGKLTIRSIVGGEEAAQDAIVVCRLEDGSKVLGIGRNKRKVQQDFDRLVGERLGGVLSRLASTPPSENSPIMETVAKVFDRGDFGPNIKTRRLVVMSDMAQLSDLMDQYARPGRYRLDQAARDLVTRDMSDVALRIHYVLRPALVRQGIQGPLHKAFWLETYRSMGADVALGHNLTIGEPADRPVGASGPTVGGAVEKGAPLAAARANPALVEVRPIQERPVTAPSGPAPAAAPPPARAMAPAPTYVEDRPGRSQALSPPAVATMPRKPPVSRPAPVSPPPTTSAAAPGRPTSPTLATPRIRPRNLGAPEVVVGVDRSEIDRVYKRKKGLIDTTVIVRCEVTSTAGYVSCEGVGRNQARVAALAGFENLRLKTTQQGRPLVVGDWFEVPVPVSRPVGY